MSDTMGKIFIVTTSGESHGVCINAEIEGCPVGLELSEADIQLAETNAVVIKPSHRLGY